jgi:hypothetical protein
MDRTTTSTRTQMRLGIPSRTRTTQGTDRTDLSRKSVSTHHQTIFTSRICPRLMCHNLSISSCLNEALAILCATNIARIHSNFRHPPKPCWIHHPDTTSEDAMEYLYEIGACTRASSSSARDQHPQPTQYGTMIAAMASCSTIGQFAHLLRS